MNELKPRSAEQATCSANAELTEADVRKALECCTSEVSRDFNCDVCPYKGEGCIINLLRDALALLRENKATLEMCAEVIERQDKELARKDALLTEWDAKCNDYETALMGKYAEIKRLKADNKDFVDLCHLLNHSLEEERAIVIDEFAERLKASLNDVARWQMHGVEGEYFIIGKSLIDQIAKEMKGEGTNDK